MINTGDNFYNYRYFAKFEIRNFKRGPLRSLIYNKNNAKRLGINN